MEKLWYLAQVKLSEHFTDDENMSVHEMLQTAQYAKSMVVQEEGYPLDGIFFIKEGKLRLFHIDEKGDSITLGILSKDACFGATSHFTLGTEKVGIETLEATVVSGYNSDQFEFFLKEKSDFINRIIEMVNKAKITQKEMFDAMHQMPVKDRLLFWLNELSLVHGSDVGNYTTINLRLTHKDLAQMIDAEESEVTENLKILAKEHAIISGFMKISLLKKEQ